MAEAVETGGAIGLGALAAEVAALRAEVAELRARPAFDPLGNAPYFDPEITDRNGLGRRIWRDEIDRPNYAYGLWLATIQAARLGVGKLQVFEFGVAFGAGLINLCRICEMITASTDVEFEIYGFDSDVGMPELIDYRDHPEIWHKGQFLSDHAAIRAQLTPNAQLISGNIKKTLPDFVAEHVSPAAPVGFVSIDVDLYSSAKQSMPVLEHVNPRCYLPTTIVYMDDVNDLLTCNYWTGEELAIEEFNTAHQMRKLQELRVRQNHPPRGWHDHLFGLHVLDHPARTGEIPEGSLHNLNITAM